MANRLIIEGNSVYEIDEECERTRGKNHTVRGQQWMQRGQSANKSEKIRKSKL